ncbi:hypothetical protein [Streptomyces sp. NPDC050535]|uniref:hypothetical protein n=1 Tax=Streptomyces sp. NPDC050535 TaxID=3365626 RepID=UPI00379AA98B
MDGSMWHLRRGTDYMTPTESFRAVVFNQARRHGRKVHTRTTDYGLVVTFSKLQGADKTPNHPEPGGVRYFATDASLADVIVLTQAEIDEDPGRIAGLTEMRISAIAKEAA